VLKVEGICRNETIAPANPTSEEAPESIGPLTKESKFGQRLLESGETVIAVVAVICASQPSLDSVVLGLFRLSEKAVTRRLFHLSQNDENLAECGRLTFSLQWHHILKGVKQQVLS
jgi:hypothetical protein